MFPSSYRGSLISTLSDQMADVWSCGVTLFVMLVGAYPFEDQADPKNFRKTINVRDQYLPGVWIQL